MYGTVLDLRPPRPLTTGLFGCISLSTWGFSVRSRDDLTSGRELFVFLEKPENWGRFYIRSKKGGTEVETTTRHRSYRESR